MNPVVIPPVYSWFSFSFKMCFCFLSFCLLCIGWDSDLSSIILLLHLIPPSAQGRKIIKCYIHVEYVGGRTSLKNNVFVFHLKVSVKLNFFNKFVLRHVYIVVFCFSPADTYFSLT